MFHIFGASREAERIVFNGKIFFHSPVHEEHMGLSPRLSCEPSLAPIPPPKSARGQNCDLARPLSLP